MAWLIQTVQEAVPDATLCLDNANHQALRTGIAVARTAPDMSVPEDQKILSVGRPKRIEIDVWFSLSNPNTKPEDEPKSAT